VRQLPHAQIIDDQERHGGEIAEGISQRVQQICGGEFEMNQGSLYPALQRLEKEGLITSDWGVTDNNRRARYCRLTAAGRLALGNEVESWKRFAAALDVVLRTS
jgi:PadR family transcriptional regulator, regulatory protein PadR